MTSPASVRPLPTAPARPARVVARPGGGRTRSRLLHLGEQLAVLGALFGLWQFVTTRADDFFFPPPVEILRAVHENWFSGSASSLFLTDAFRMHMAPSLGRMLLGWGIAGVVGITVGTLIGLSRHLPEYVEPIVHFLRSAPGPAILPIFLLMFGIGGATKVAFIAFGSLWPVLLNAIDGVRGVDRGHIDTASVFRVRRRRQIFTIVLPSAAPKIFAGLRISLAIALVLMVVSDMINSSSGFGFYLIAAQRSFRVLDVWAGIVLIALIGFVLNWGFVVAERRLLAWHRGYRGRAEET